MPKRAGLTYRFPDKAAPYAAALEAAGIEVVHITPDAPHGLDGLDGLVISGGTDVDPARYGQAAHAMTQEPDRERDEMEAGLLGKALAANLPVLCICRGMQLFNVLHGGTLDQHIDGVGTHEQRPPKVEFDDAVHAVEVAQGTKLEEILGPGAHEVNSRHHQAVDRVGAGLAVSAVAPDGTIEAVERPDLRFAVAVQWHPEDRVASDGRDRALFEAFARALCGANL